MMKIKSLLLLFLLVTSCKKEDVKEPEQVQSLKDYITSNIFYRNDTNGSEYVNDEQVTISVDLFYKFYLTSQKSFDTTNFSSAHYSLCNPDVPMYSCFVVYDGIKNGTLMKDDENSIVWKKDSSNEYIEITRAGKNINLKYVGSRTFNYILELSDTKTLNSKKAERNNLECICD